MKLIFIVVIIAVVYLYFKSKKTSAIPSEQRQPDPSKGKTVTGPDGKTYVVPKSLRKAEKMGKEAGEGTVYELLCTQQAADIGYEMFKKNDLIGDPENNMMDADVFFHQCFFTAAWQDGREGIYSPDPAKSIHYYEIFVEVAMALAEKNWFKFSDLGKLDYAWEQLACAYSAGEGCPVQEGKAKDYFKNAFTMAADPDSYCWDPIETQVRIVKYMLGGYPQPTATYSLLAFQFIQDMVQRRLVEGAALMEEYLYFIRDKEEQLGYSAKTDFEIYCKGVKEENSTYACYKLGECYYKGFGVEKDEARGLSLLQAAAESDSLSAVQLLLEIDPENKEKWEKLKEEIRARLIPHMQVMQGVTGVTAEEPAPLRVPKDFSDLDEEEEASAPISEEESGSSKEEYDPYGEYQKTHDLSRLPNIIYDDSGNCWHKQWGCSSHVTYHNDDGQEITINYADIQGSFAHTNVGDFRWY